MDKEIFQESVQAFFKALRQKTLMIIIDSASKNEKAVFSLISFDDGKIRNYAGMLDELGFKCYSKINDRFVTYCAGRYSLFILDNIGREMRGKGIELPEDYDDAIQHQYAI